jgi:hypothetical protein
MEELADRVIPSILQAKDQGLAGEAIISPTHSTSKPAISKSRR